MAPPTPGPFDSPATPEMHLNLGAATMQPVQEDDSLDPRFMQYGGPAGGHPVDPRNPFDQLPPELHQHAVNIMQSQNVSAEAACREVFDHFQAAMLADMNARETAPPDRSILDEEWTQLEPLYSKPTAYMHHMLSLIHI